MMTGVELLLAAGAMGSGVLLGLAMIRRQDRPLHAHRSRGFVHESTTNLLGVLVTGLLFGGTGLLVVALSEGARLAG